MKKQLSAHKFGKVYDWMGINLSDLGCIMLDLEPLETPQMFCQDGVTSYIYSLPLYKSKNPDRFWIDGYVGLETAHITMLYGLMQPGKNIKTHVNEVLKGWKIDDVKIDHFGYFESPYKDEDYYCIVAHIKPTPKLIEGHERLEFLPHINTFTGYKPHSTIAYIKKNDGARDWFINDLNKAYVGKTMKVKGINYGGKD